MKRISPLLISLCILMLGPLTAQTTTNPDEQKCIDLSGDDAIAACTRAIDSHTLPQKNLANTYYNRGCEYRNKNEFDLAIADYNFAIQLDPTLSQAYNNRAVCLYNKGEYDRAEKDYLSALQLDPKHVNSYYGLGNIYRVQGNYSKAIENYTQALNLSPDLTSAIINRAITYSDMGAYANAISDFRDAIRKKSTDAYAPLLIAVAKMHTGDNAITEELSDQVSTYQNNWPMPVMQYYLGRLSADDLLVSAKDPSATVQQSQLCETHFYIGEWQLHHGQKAAGVENLKAAQSGCNKNYLEYIIATNDLNQQR